jgi:hypothetical protein
MYYKKTEEYRFSMPREYKACIEFKNRLEEMGIKYLDEGGNMYATISVRTTGDFEVDENCSFYNVGKESL